jgi:hypothetical protein
LLLDLARIALAAITLTAIALAGVARLTILLRLLRTVVVAARTIARIAVAMGVRGPD